MSKKKLPYDFLRLDASLSRTIVTVLIMICSINLFAEKYAGEIFKMGAGVRNFALGRTGLTDMESPAKAYWNPALLCSQEGMQAEIMHAEEFKGNLKYDIASINFGKKSNLGIVISRIGIDDIKKTALPIADSLPSNDNRPYAYKSINNADYLLYVGIGREISDKLHLGLSPKLVYRNLNEESCYGIGADLGAYYMVNNNLCFGAKLRDFFGTQMFYENGTNQSVNPGLDLEGSLITKLPVFKKRMVLYVNSEINTEGMKDAATMSFGEFSVDWHTGLQVDATDNIKLYTGYDIDALSAGMSFYLKSVSFNYSFEHNTGLDNSHRISLGINL